MGEKKVVIFDSKIQFAERLVTYFENHEEYNTVLFTNWDKLECYADKHTKDFFIIEDGVSSRQLISRNELNALLICEDKKATDIGSYKFVYRYIPVPDLIVRMRTIMEGDAQGEEQDFKVYSIISVIHRLDMDNILHVSSSMQQYKVLILDFRNDGMWMNEFNSGRNIEGDNGLEVEDTVAARHSLSDILYAVHERSETLAKFIEDNVTREGGYDVISGLVAQEDTMHVTAEDVDYLIREVKKGKMYDRLLFIVECNMLEVLAGSIAASGMIGVTRGSRKEEIIYNDWENRGMSFYKRIELDCEDKYIDMTVDELDNSQTGYMKVREVVDRFAKEGIL